MTALFSKNKTKEDKFKKQEANEEPKSLEAGESVNGEKEEGTSGSSAFSNAGGSATHKILKGFYVSEKASLGNSVGQYTFKVFGNTNKTEVKKEVSRLFNVKVKDVKIIITNEKRRDFGRHPGSKSGFKKAIVVLEEGYSIGQAKP